MKLKSAAPMEVHTADDLDFQPVTQSVASQNQKTQPVSAGGEGLLDQENLRRPPMETGKVISLLRKLREKESELERVGYEKRRKKALRSYTKVALQIVDYDLFGNKLNKVA